MKIQILSDTHNEFFGSGSFRRSDNGLWACEIPITDADVIILAGDIDKGIRGVEWAIKESQRQKNQLSMFLEIAYLVFHHNGHDLVAYKSIS